jgi:hypothetical protein
VPRSRKLQLYLHSTDIFTTQCSTT